jgi:pimeloyl-ACP methyl ester carboxylesterase
MTATGIPRLEPAADFVPAKAARQAENRAYAQLYQLLGRPVRQPPRGFASVILAPGFISGDVSLTVLARHLRRQGCRTFGSELGANLGCTDDMVEKLIRRIERVVALERRPVVLVGHSRGGMIVKLAAQRRPDLIGGVVVMSAPVTGALSVAPHVRKQLEVLFRLHRRGLTSVIGTDCVTGDCAGRIAAELTAPFPPGIGYSSIYTRADAIIDWRSCLDPAAEQIEIDSSHTGLATDAAAHAIVAARLAALSQLRS